MAITVVSGTDVMVAASGANGPQTTAAIDSTGATMIEVTVAWHVSASVAPAISDSKSNTFASTGIVQGVGAAIRKWWTINPTVGSGHTFTMTHTGGYAVLMVRGYAGSPVLDINAVPGSANGTTHPSAADFYAGQITPSEDGALITSAICMANANYSGLAVDNATGGGTLALIGQQQHSSGVNVGAAYADQIQTTATLSNHHYSWTPNGVQVALVTVAYIEGGSPGPTPASENNLLTGDGHTVEGSNDLIAGVTGTLVGDRSVLFSLDGAANSVVGDGTFWVFGNTIIEGTLTVNGSPMTAIDLSAELDGLGT